MANRDDGQCGSGPPHPTRSLGQYGVVEAFGEYPTKGHADPSQEKQRKAATKSDPRGSTGGFGDCLLQQELACIRWMWVEVTPFFIQRKQESCRDLDLLPNVGPPEGRVFRPLVTPAGWLRRRES